MDKLLRESGVPFEKVNYYVEPLSKKKLADLVRKLGIKPRELLRKSEPIYKELGLASGEFSDSELIALMVEHPDLLQRPIVERGDRAVMGRDPSIVEPQESLIVLSDVDSVLSLNESLTTDLFVIGGAQIYEAFLPRIEEWIITEVPLKVDKADAFMPEGYLEGFKEADKKPIGEGLQVKYYERLK